MAARSFPFMNHYIDRLNRSFGDRIGYVPDRFTEGIRQPQYRWAWTPDLFYRAEARGETSQFRLHHHDRWAVVKWEPPIPPQIWQLRYGTELAYSPNGMFVMTDFVLPEREEPTELLTDFAIASILEKRSMSFAECLAAVRDRQERSERAGRQQINDLIDDTCLTYDSVPGARGGPVSFGGIEA